MLKTFGDVIAEYLDHHPEAKFMTADGGRCVASTRGLLRRRPVWADTTGRHIGKEATSLDEVESGVVHDWDDVQLVVLDPKRDPILTLLVPALAGIPAKRIAKAVGRTVRQAQDYRSGKVRPPTDLVPLLRSLVRAATAG